MEKRLLLIRIQEDSDERHLRIFPLCCTVHSSSNAAAMRDRAETRESAKAAIGAGDHPVFAHDVDEALQRASGHQSKAAKALGISPQALNKRLKAN